MKHPIHRHSRNGGAEWLGALFTLCILSGIYFSMDNFDSYSSLYSNAKDHKTTSVASPYWNKKLAYGFRGVAGDSYSGTETASSDKVLVTNTEKKSTESSVRVSFYPEASIDEIEKLHNSDAPRAYSRLSHGIAVIEGDLNSPSAKTILATLHTK